MNDIISMLQLIEKQSISFFEEMDCTWLDGGCHTFARGILPWLQAHGYQPSLAAILSELPGDTIAAHVVASVRIDEQIFYVDANGIQTAEQLLAHWSERPLLWRMTIHLEPFDDEDDLAWLEYEVPLFQNVVESLQKIIQDE